MATTDVNSRNFLTPVEVSKILGCSQQTIRRMIKDDELPHISIGKQKRIAKDVIEQKIQDSLKLKEKDNDNTNFLHA